MKVKKKNIFNRRSFVGKISLGALGTVLLSSLPGKLFANGKTSKKVTVKIHPNSVKRK